ncbi:MAG: RICIN domain-containing protein [Paludibacteraceae bacterium]
MKFRKLFLISILSCTSLTLLADSGIYICGHFRRDRTKTVAALKSSGFTFGILFNIHVESDGTLTTDGEVICKDGKYVFDKVVEGYPNDIAQENYIDDVVSLLSGKTSLQRLEYCIGGWGNHAYKNVTDLINSQGTGTSGILYKNFKALKDAIPEVIAINNDIEHDYYANTQSQFHSMLYDMGFKTTIAPYTNKSYWESFVTKVETARPGAIDRNYLQCYGGGSGNNPSDWEIGNLPVYGSRDIEANPGLTYQEIVDVMTNWKNNAGIAGGFYWNYNYDRDLKKFSAPINDVFGDGNVEDRSRIVAMVYPEKHYNTPQTNFVFGSYNKVQIQDTGFDISHLASIKLKENVRMVLFTGDLFSGDSIVVNSDTNDVSAIVGAKKINSWKIQAKPIDGISGKSFFIKNKQSGFVLKPSRNNTNTTIFQMDPDTTQYSIWQFEPLENGLYKIINKGSNRVLQTVNNDQSHYLHDGLSIVQDMYDGSSNQRFIIQQNNDNSFKLIPLSSLKYVGIADYNQLTKNSIPVQRKSITAPSTDWILTPAEIQNSIDNTDSDGIKIYPKIAKDHITIDATESIFRLKIIDAKGQTLFNKQVKSGNIDISKLAKGIYILQIKTNKQIQTAKIIKS